MTECTEPSSHQRSSRNWSARSTASAARPGRQRTSRSRMPPGAVLDDSDLELEPPGKTPHQAALGLLVDWLHGHEAGWSIAGVGHRVVHGATASFRSRWCSMPAMVDALRGFIPLAPLHQPHNLAGIAPSAPAARRAAGGLLRHRLPPQPARAGALLRPAACDHRGGHASATASTASPTNTSPACFAAHPPAQGRGRSIVAHLGNGASMCALHGLKSVATTMGFTALDGLMMGTRCGAIDPGVLLHLMDFRGMGRRELTKLLYKESGLLGVSGISQDMRAARHPRRPRRRGGRAVLLPHRARNRLAGGGAGRPRRAGVHRRHRRTWRRGERKGLCRPRLARRLSRFRRQRRQRDPNFRRREPDRGLRNSH
jgi:hypothetical protein